MFAHLVPAWPLRKPLQSEGGFVLRGGTVHTISGPVIEDGSVVVRNGKIVGVGKSLAVPKGFKSIDIQGQLSIRG